MKVPLDDFNTCDDFFKFIVTCHTLQAAMTLMKMKSLEDIPVHSKITDGLNTWMQTKSERKEILEGVCLDLVDRFTTVEVLHCS